MAQSQISRKLRTAALPDADPVIVSTVHIVETNPPEDEEPVQWRLLTTLDVKCAEAAVEIVGFHLQR